jgi:UDP-glucose 4-epimerase
LLRKICLLLDKPFAPHFAPPRVGDVLHSWSDISAARKYLGYETEVDLDEGLRRTVEYYAGQAASKRAG